MGHREASIIVHQIEAFNQASRTRSGLTPVQNAAEILGKGFRTLGESHFQDLDNFFRQMLQATYLKLEESYHYDPRLPVKRRVMELALMYMSVKKGDIDSYSPTMIWASINHQNLLFTSRKMPMFFCSEHIEYRAIQRTGKLFAWRSNETNHAMMIGMLLAEALAEKMKRTGKTICPVTLPDGRGLHLGQAYLCDQKSFYPDMLVASHRSTAGKPFVAGLESQICPSGSPESYLHLRTIIDQGHFSWPQRQLYNAFMEIINPPEVKKALDIMMHRYPFHSDTGTSELPVIKSLKQKVADLVNSALWDAANYKSEAHLRPAEQHYR